MIFRKQKAKQLDTIINRIQKQVNHLNRRKIDQQQVAQEAKLRRTSFLKKRVLEQMEDPLYQQRGNVYGRQAVNGPNRHPVRRTGPSSSLFRRLPGYS